MVREQPLSVIEAQSLGTPVLGARIGGIPELIEEGISGMLFEAKNTVDLKQKIEAMFIHKFDYELLAKTRNKDILQLLIINNWWIFILDNRKYNSFIY